MKRPRGVVCLVQTALIFLAATPFAVGQQNTPEVRRAQPVNEPPTPKAVPFDTPVPSAKPRRSPPEPTASETEGPATDSEASDRRQLDYANGLFSRKLYDLAVPEYEKFLGQYPGAPGRSSAFFYLAECYRALNKTSAARTSFQSVLDNYGESEFAGPAAYGIAEILFTQKDFAGALPLFHKAGAKSKEAALGLSAKYFEARCLENVDRKDEAQNLYQQVAETKNPNPYREDARMAAGTIALAHGRKLDAFRNYEALANETQKPALKAEAMVRAGMVAVDLQQTEKGKTDKAMADKALSLLQKGRSLPEAGKWRGIAQVGLLRMQYQSGQYDKVIAEFKRAEKEIPEEVRAEMM
ncbi:MAG TPA: tetratricopeptide repeat protein, partial [Chthoniobacterales bacterium]